MSKCVHDWVPVKNTHNERFRCRRCGVRGKLIDGRIVAEGLKRKK